MHRKVLTITIDLNLNVYVVWIFQARKKNNIIFSNDAIEISFIEIEGGLQVRKIAIFGR